MRNAERCSADFTRRRKTGVDYGRIFCSLFFREIVMTSSRIGGSISRAAIAAAVVVAGVVVTEVVVTEVSWANGALDSQCPGGGMGTGRYITQGGTGRSSY